jgi:rare lipoprotein A (peptidoglycan hydrolase)
MRELKITKGKIINLTAIVAFPLFIFCLQFLGNAQVKDLPPEVRRPVYQIIDSDKLNIAHELKLEKIVESSHYGKEFHMRRTANGETFNMNDFTAAHRRLPFGSILKVTNVKNGESVLTRVNDRGPFVKGRELDLSYQAAKEIGGLGVAQVKMEGFVPGMLPKTGDKEKSYYYGYSLSSDLVCVPAKVIKTIDTVSGFNNAYNLYKQKLKDNPNKDIFLFVDANNRYNDGRNKQNQYYIIGELRKTALISHSGL